MCHIQHLQSQNKTKQESNIRRAVRQLSQGGTQRVRRVVVETLELQKNERSLVADPAIANPRNVSRPREPSTWLRNERFFDSLF